MSLLFTDGFDRYAASGSIDQTNLARYWTFTPDMYTTVTAQTGRYTGKAIQFSGMSDVTLAKTISPSGTKLFITLNVYSASSTSGFLKFGTTSQIAMTDTGITVTYGGTAGSTHSWTANAWHTVELVIDSTTGATQRLYVDGILMEARVIAPGTGTTISLVSDSSSSTPYFDDLIVCDGSGTAGNARLGNGARVERLTPSATDANTFALISGTNAHTVLDNVPYSSEYVASNADAQTVKCSLANATGTVTTIAGVQVETLISQRDATTQGLNLVTSWAAGADSTHSVTPTEALQGITKAYSTRGDGTAISAADVTALAVALTQT